MVCLALCDCPRLRFIQFRTDGLAVPRHFLKILRIHQFREVIGKRVCEEVRQSAVHGLGLLGRGGELHEEVPVLAVKEVADVNPSAFLLSRRSAARSVTRSMA